MATQEFQVTKSYEGYPSKKSVEFTGTEQECKDYLQGCLSLSLRNGADVISKCEYHYSCANYDSNDSTVTFEIE